MDHIFKFGITIVSFGISIFFGNLLIQKRYFSSLLNRQNRYGAIDGLRGFLAISVFFAHFIITWHWKISGNWESPPEVYYRNYGVVSVAIFFMITGFLFTSKIIKNRSSSTNWFNLYESRIFRIYPLYLFIILLITLVVFYESRFNLKVGLTDLIKQYLRWILFDGGDINLVPNTAIIIAGVQWTLAYEWLFYLFLPILDFIFRFKYIGGLAILLLSFIGNLKPIQIQLIGQTINTSYFILFAIGGYIAYLYQNQKFSQSIIRNIRSNTLSSLTTLIAISMIFYPNKLDLLHIVLISLFFMSILLGNDMFGILSFKSSLLLGELSYSIYLTHGILLYILFSISPIQIQTINMYNYLLFLPILCILVITISLITFIIIEKPSINFGRKYIISNMLTSVVKQNIK